MTGTSSSKGRLFRNFDSYKNQEWLRRRKLRIEQVRQQSSEIAKALRQKVENEEKLRNLELAKVEEQKFKNWRAEKLDEMERKLRFALEEFGLGHRLIENEPDPKEILETRNEINKWKAQERGEIAVQEELKKKQIEKNKKMSPIERKKMTRKLEDLRSALVCSLRTHTQFIKTGENLEIPEPVKDLDNIERKTLIKKKRINSIRNQNLPPANVKVVTVKKKGLENVFPENPSQPYQEKLNEQTADVKSKTSQNKTKIWSDTNDVKNAPTANLNNKSLESKTILSVANSNTARSDKSVEFYDYNSRYQSKTFRDYPDMVEKVETWNMPQGAALHKETMINQLSARKKEKADVACRERGNQALKKERINREYNDLITKLNDLHKKEKIIKAMQHIPSDFIHMNDDRILEKTRNKQRLMNSKFESLYFETITSKNDLNAEAELPSNIPWNSDSPDSPERVSTKVSISPKNLKANSPITSVDSPKKNRTVSKTVVSGPKKTKKKIKRKLVAHIDKTLKEGRELRASVQNKSPQHTSPVEESENEKTVKVKPKSVSPVRKEAKKKSKTFKNQISQTEDFEKSKCLCYYKEEEKQMFDDQTENDSALISNATSYKSPPCEIQSSKLIEFLQLSDLLSKMEGHKDSINLKRQIEETLLDLLSDMQSNRSEDRCPSPKQLRSPTLKDYILKLLNMSRERVANLSVSAASTPTPDFEPYSANHFETIKSESESSCSCQSQGESQKSNDEVEPEELGEPVENWKTVLEEASESNEDIDSPQLGIEESRPESIDDYNEITKKCEKRIEELSNLLQKVRQEKKNLLIPSETSSHCPPNSEILFDGSLPKEDDLSENESTESRSQTDSSDAQLTIDTFPDVLEELLQKKILTSPFKWYKKACANQPPSADLTSIEDITHNFRRQMSKIKPCIFDSEELPTLCSSTEELCEWND